MAGGAYALRGVVIPKKLHARLIHQGVEFMAKKSPTFKDDLIKRTKEKVIEIFGHDFMVAKAIEDPEFDKKLGELIAWIIGEAIFEAVSAGSPPMPSRTPTTSPYPSTASAQPKPKWR